MTAGLLIAGAALVAVGGAVSAARGGLRHGLALQAAGAVAIAAAGFAVLLDGTTLGAGFTSAFDPQLGVDALSGFFLGTLGAVAAPALVFSIRYLDPTRAGRAVAALTAAFVLVLALVVCARDPLTFLLGWELMTLLPAAVILVSRRANRSSRTVVFAYLAITHLGGAGTWVAVLLLAEAGAIGNPSAIDIGLRLAGCDRPRGAGRAWARRQASSRCTSWLPRAHPIAPAPVSALMSGVMIKVAVYGLVRVLVEWIGEPPAWLGIVVLGAGGRVRRRRGAVRALPARSQAASCAALDREHRHHRARSRGVPRSSRARRPRHGPPSHWVRRCSTPSTTRSSRHCSSLVRAHSSGQSERSSSTASVACCEGCRGRPERSSSARWRSRGCRRSTASPPSGSPCRRFSTCRRRVRPPPASRGRVALAALAATAALAVFCFVKVVGLVLLGSPRRRGGGGG